jgi:hypothetical protein
MKQYTKSKTLWINVIAIIAIVSAGEFGIVLDGTTQAAMLAMINIILRKMTTEEIVWRI